MLLMSIPASFLQTLVKFASPDSPLKANNKPTLQHALQTEQNLDNAFLASPV